MRCAPEVRLSEARRGLGRAKHKSAWFTGAFAGGLLLLAQQKQPPLRLPSATAMDSALRRARDSAEQALDHLKGQAVIERHGTQMIKLVPVTTDL